jgi:hypothetical protein
MAPRFPRDVADQPKDAKILGVRSGVAHRYTGVWPVVVNGRLFVRSWNDKPTGWFRAFLEQPRGSIQLGKKEIEVRAVRIRSDALRASVTAAYAAKYTTKASQKWVTGFAEPIRASCTLELVPVAVARLSRRAGE